MGRYPFGENYALPTPTAMDVTSADGTTIRNKIIKRCKYTLKKQHPKIINENFIILECYFTFFGCFSY